MEMKILSIVKRDYLIFCIIAFSVSFFYAHYHTALTVEDHYATYDQLTRGVGRTPMQYRALISWLVQWLSTLPFLSAMSLRRLYMWTDHISVFFLVLAFRQYLRRWFHNPTLCSILSFTIVPVLPIIFIVAHHVRYPYDMSAITFFTVGLILIKERRWTWYYLLFPLATLNRETSCFLTITYIFVYFKKDKLSVIAVHCIVQLLIWLSIKYILYRIYFHNIGPGLFENRIVLNTVYLLNPKEWPFFFSILAYLWIPVFLFYRMIDDDFVYRTLWVSVPFVLSMMIVGSISEMRIYGELIPIYLLAVLLILRNFFKLEFKHDS